MKKTGVSLAQVRIIYIATTLFLAALSIYAFVQVKHLISSYDWISHTNRVTLSLEKISTAVIDAETNQKSFLLIGDSANLVRRDIAFSELNQYLNVLDSLTKDNQQQVQNLVALHRAVNEKLASMKKVLAGYVPLAMAPQFRYGIAEGIQKTKNVKQVINTMSANEARLLVVRTQKYERLAFITAVFVIVLFLGALLILLTSYLRINSAYHEAKRLELVANTNADELKKTLVSKNLLQESEERYHQLIYSSPSAIGTLYGEDLVITTANEPIIAIWGKGKEIIGKKYFEALPELAEQGYKEVFIEVYKTGIPFNAVETPVFILQEGIRRLKYYNFLLYPQRNLNGDINGIGIIATEVTSQAILNNKIKESEKRFRLLADSMPQHIWTSDPQGNLNYFNQSVFNYSGLSFEKINKDGWLQIVHPDDRENNIKQWINSITTGKDFLLEHRFRRHDGEYRWQLSRAIPQKDEEGEIQMWVGSSTDIQEQKTFAGELEKQVKERTKELVLLNETLRKSEERYHLMVEEVQDYAILYLNRDGIVENWNAGAERIKGYRANEIIGKSFSNFYTEEDRKNNLPQKLLNKAVQSGKAVQEGWRVRNDGSLFWASVVITAIHNDKQEVMGFSKVTHDLTDKKNAEDKLKQNASLLQQKNNDLERMNKELQSFAYISSHDLQEPLRKIQTFSTQILEKEETNLSEKGKDSFKRMQAAACRMQTLINDLLAYSRSSTSERKYEITDLNKIMNEVKEDLKEELMEKHATIEATGLCSLNIIPFQFRQLMHNLIGNALKFSKPGSPPHIQVKSKIAEGIKFNNKQLSPHLKYCHISVTDNGIGFEQQYSEKIFEVFQRLHGKTDYQGTGIGLSIVKKIVENHHGIITATGEVTKGASFDIYIPA